MKSIISGVAIEILLISLLLATGMGPCGPGSPWGQAVLWLHYPGIAALEIGRHVRLPGGVDELMFFGLSLGIWSVLIYAVLRWRQKYQPA
ncbi:MAG: hypothetical protein ACO1TE_26965 [Prosthecobacter sp.]